MIILYFLLSAFHIIRKIAKRIFILYSFLWLSYYSICKQPTKRIVSLTLLWLCVYILLHVFKTNSIRTIYVLYWISRNSKYFERDFQKVTLIFCFWWNSTSVSSIFGCLSPVCRNVCIVSLVVLSMRHTKGFNLYRDLN